MTGDPIQDLFVRFGMDTAGYQEGVQQIVSSAPTFEDRIKQLVDSGMTLNQALASVGAAATSAAAPIGDAGAAAQQAYGPFVELSRALADFGESAGTKAQSDKLATALQDLGDSAGKAYKPVKDTGEAVSQVVLPANSASGAVQQLSDVFGQMGQQLLSLAGIAITAATLRQLAEASLEAFGEVQKSEVALNLMTGSAHEAAKSIAGLKDLGLQDSLSFPSLVSANQRFIAFGLSVAQSNDVLRIAADFAAATGNSFDTIVSKMVLMIGEGMLSSRTLKDMAADSHLVADAMHEADLTTEQVAFAFKHMDEEGRLEIFKRLLVEVKDWEGAAAQMSQTVPGQFQQAKNIITFALQEIGATLAGAGPGFVFLAKVAGTAAMALMTAFKEMADGAVDIGLIFVDLGTGIAQWADDMAHGRLVQGAQDVKNIWTGLKSTGAKFTADFAKDQDEFKTSLDKIWAAIPEQEKLHLGKMPAIITSAKDETDKAWKEFVDQENKMALPFGKVSRPMLDPLGTDITSLVVDTGATEQIRQQYDAAIAAHKKGQQEIQKAVAGLPEFMSGGWDIFNDKLDGTMQKMEKAAPAMSIAFDPISKSLGMITARTKEASDTTGQFIDRMLFLAETSGGTMLSVLKLNDAYKTLGAESLPEVARRAEDVAQAFATITGSSMNAQQLLLADTSKMTDDQQRLWLDATTKIAASWKQMGQAIPDDTAIAMEQVKNHLQNATMSVTDAFRKLGITSSMDLNLTAETATAAYQKIRDSGTASAVDVMKAWEAATQKQIAAAGVLGPLYLQLTNSLSKGFADDLIQIKPLSQSLNEQATAAKNAYQAVLGGAEAAVTARSDVQDAYAEMMRKQTLYDNLGATASSALREEYKRLADAAKTNYDKIKQAALDQVPAQQQVVDAYKKLTDAQNLAANPTIWLRFTDTFKKGIADVAKTILETLIKGALLELGKVLTGLSDQAGVLGTVLGGLGKILTGGKTSLPGAIPIPGFPTAIPGFPTGVPITGTTPMPDLGPIGGAGPGSLSSISAPAGSGAAAPSSLLGSISSIANIAGAIGSIGGAIVSGIQGAHMNNLLGEIEISTRYLKVGLVDGNSLLAEHIGEIRDRMTQLISGPGLGVFNAQGDSGLRIAPDSIAQLRGGALAIATGSIGVFNAPGDSGLRLSPDSIGSLADAIASRMGNGGDSNSFSSASIPAAVLDSLDNQQFRRRKLRGLAPQRA